MQEFISKYLNKLGYTVNEEPFKSIDIASKWYHNQSLPFHKRKTFKGIEYDLQRCGFAKRLCADDANLCEVINITAQKSEEENKIILDVLKDNNFNTMYRKQLELMSAEGTVGCYLTIKDCDLMEDGTVEGGKAVINYCSAENIVVLNCINNEILECAFMGESYDIEGSKTCIVVFRLNNCKYECITAYFNDNGKKISEQTMKYGNVKPFAIMRVAEVNNLKNMKGYGLPKLFNVEKDLQMLDLTYNLWYRDLDKSDKIVLINKELCEFDEETGKYLPPNQEMQKLFIQVGESSEVEAGGEKFHEYNPIIRMEDVEKSLELSLSMLSMRFGFGTKKYKFESGRIVTATEYVGENQDKVQELNKQWQESKRYIEDIILFIRYYQEEFNSIKMGNDDINIQFDDSYIQDKEKKLDDMKNDAITFDIDELKIMYLKDKYNIAEEVAKAWIENAKVQEFDEE